VTKRILVGLAGTPYTPVAIHTAVELAARHGAELTGVTVVDLDRLSAPVASTGDPVRAGLEREHRLRVTRERVAASVAEFEGAAREAGLAPRVLREVGDPFDVLVAASRYHDATVLGVRGLFELDLGASDPGKTLAKLLGGGVRPILAVGPAYRPVRRVLAAYSGSLESARTLRGWVQHRLWPGEELRLVTFQEDEAVGRSLLEDAAAYCRAHGLEPTGEWVRGDPRTGLLPYAEAWGADLLVLGNSAGTLVLRQFFGEVALRAMREAPIPLFLGQ
jgi:nucleotide-binding universal stress UspA family protein